MTITEDRRKLRCFSQDKQMDAGTDFLTTKGTKDTKTAFFECFVPFVVYILVAAPLRCVFRGFSWIVLS
jgi:hypothetical protein